MKRHHMIENAETFRTIALARRNRGLTTGKRAKGHSFKRRPDPEAGSWDDIVLRAKAGFRDACALARAEYDWKARLQFEVADITDGDGNVSL